MYVYVCVCVLPSSILTCLYVGHTHTHTHTNIHTRGSLCLSRVFLFFSGCLHLFLALSLYHSLCTHAIPPPFSLPQVYVSYFNTQIWQHTFYHHFLHLHAHLHIYLHAYPHCLISDTNKHIYIGMFVGTNTLYVYLFLSRIPSLPYLYLHACPHIHTSCIDKHIATYPISTSAATYPISTSASHHRPTSIPLPYVYMHIYVPNIFQHKSTSSLHLWTLYLCRPYICVDPIFMDPISVYIP